MDEKDFIDISPEKGGATGKKTTVFQEPEWQHIEHNPAKLTKEGIAEKIKLWERSGNKHVLIKYQTMLKRCKNITSSGKTSLGETIFGVDKDGVPNWVGQKPKKKEVTEKK